MNEAAKEKHIQDVMAYVEKVICPTRMTLEEADSFLNQLQMAMIERRQAIIEDLKYGQG